MSLLGINLLLLIGPKVPLPAVGLVEYLESAEVQHSDEGRSGFQITFKAGREGIPGILDYNILKDPRLKPSNRIIMAVTPALSRSFSYFFLIAISFAVET